MEIINVRINYLQCERSLRSTICLMRTGYISLADNNVGKVCRGASDDESMSGTEQDHYDQLKAEYTNCTYVLGNIEVFGMQSLKGKTFDFFNAITEVNGYVKVTGQLPEGITSLPFPNLRIIRGGSLTRYSDNRDKEYSLFIYDIPRLSSLGLISLRGKACSLVAVGN